MKTKELEKHIGLLGLTVKDKVTGLIGVVTSISFDLFGCIQAVVKPSVNEKGEPQDGQWYDVSRLEITNTTPVMEVVFATSTQAVQGKKGPADKPMPS